MRVKTQISGQMWPSQGFVLFLGYFQSGMAKWLMLSVPLYTIRISVPCMFPICNIFDGKRPQNNFWFTIAKPTGSLGKSKTVATLRPSRSEDWIFLPGPSGQYNLDEWKSITRAHGLKRLVTIADGLDPSIPLVNIVLELLEGSLSDQYIFLQ